MSSRVRRSCLVLAPLGLLLLLFASACATRPAPTASTLEAQASPLDAASASSPAPVAPWSTPGTPHTRAEPDSPLDPRLIVTTQVAHGDIFLHSLQGTGPRYHAVARLYRGQKAYLLPFARNYARAGDGRTDLTYRLTIQKADGTFDGDPFEGVLWQEKIPGPGLVLYPASTVSFWAEPADPVGPYRLVAQIRDHLSGDNLELTHTLELVDYIPPGLPADFDPDRWFTTYYNQPTPELALPALPRFFEKLPADRRQGAMPPLLGFYDQILTDNPWLLPHFATRLAAAQPDEAFALSLVLGFHLRSAAAAPVGIDEALWQRLADFRTHQWPGDPALPLETPAQLDALWGRFYASALYEPIERLLEPLAHVADLGAAERWRQAQTGPDSTAADPAAGLPLLDPADPSTPADLRREILLRTALWSLRANARQHPLVRGYLEWTLHVGRISPASRPLLERALAPDQPVPPAK